MINEIEKLKNETAAFCNCETVRVAKKYDDRFIVMFKRNDGFIVTNYNNNGFFWSDYNLSEETAKEVFKEKLGE